MQLSVQCASSTTYTLIHKCGTFVFKNYRDLALVSRDSLQKVILLTNQIVYERWTRLQDGIKTQVSSLSYTPPH